MTHATITHQPLALLIALALSFLPSLRAEDRQFLVISDIHFNVYNGLFHKIVPAISPIYGNNPAVQVYEADSETGVLTNWQTHFLDLKVAGGGTPTNQWSDEYNATGIYGNEEFNATTVTQLFETIRGNPSGLKSKAYRLFYQVSANEIPQSELPVYTCAILNATFAAYHACLTGHGLPAPVQMKSPAELRRLAGGLEPPDTAK